ncbi:hypothetical protein JB92DRAFT_3038429, partial [Gautieria morchelliformis]
TLFSLKTMMSNLVADCSPDVQVFCVVALQAHMFLEVIPFTPAFTCPFLCGSPERLRDQDLYLLVFTLVLVGATVAVRRIRIRFRLVFAGLFGFFLCLLLGFTVGRHFEILRITANFRTFGIMGDDLLLSSGLLFVCVTLRILQLLHV